MKIDFAQFLLAIHRILLTFCYIFANVLLTKFVAHSLQNLFLTDLAVLNILFIQNSLYDNKIRNRI